MSGPLVLTKPFSKSQIATLSGEVLGRTTLSGNRTVFIGTSNTLSGETAGVWAPGFATLAAQLSEGRLLKIANKGVIGDTSVDMLARFDADVTALDPDIVVIEAGPNDVFNDLSTARSMAAILGMVERGRHNGTLPLLLTTTPRTDGDYANALAAYRYGVLNLGARLNVPVIDIYPAVGDPDTGEWLDGMETGDGAHLSGLGARSVALAIRDKLVELYPVAPRTLGSLLAGDGASLITNGTFVGDANEDGVADDWSEIGTTGTQTQSLFDAGDDIAGNFQRYDQTAGGGSGLFFQEIIPAASGFAEGDRMRYEGRFRTSGLAASHALSIRCYAYTAALAPIGDPFTPVNTLGVDIDSGLFQMEFDVPATCGNLIPSINPSSSGTGITDVAEFALLNLTELGMA